MKKAIPGLFTAVLKGAPLVMDLVNRFKKKKVHTIDELQAKAPTELIGIIKGHEEKENESWIMFLVKSVITLGSVWFVLYLTKQFGISREDILTLMGILK